MFHLLKQTVSIPLPQEEEQRTRNTLLTKHTDTNLQKARACLLPSLCLVPLRVFSPWDAVPSAPTVSGCTNSDRMKIIHHQIVASVPSSSLSSPEHPLPSGPSGSSGFNLQAIMTIPYTGQGLSTRSYWTKN